MATTITIGEETKKVLKALKNDKNWDEFLRELSEAYFAMKRERVRKKLANLFVKDFKSVKVKRWAKEY
jgi:hypothetical protein